jgi:hypothetical protein
VLGLKEVVLFLNGQEVLKRDISKGPQFDLLEELTIGEDTDYRSGIRAYSDFFKGDIAELIVIGEVVSEEERSRIEGFLSSKYELE